MSKQAAQPSFALIDNAPWEAFRRPYVRDLAYVLACPNVLTQWLDFAPHQNTHSISVHPADFWLAQFNAYQLRLHELDNTSAYQELTRYLLARPSPNRLGFHFEGLLAFWLEDGYARRLHPYETLANNIQLYSGKQTTGELDLILYNHKEAQVEHWELAIKFFMGSPPFAPENWVGINSNDNLERKMTYMQTKQFRAVWVETESQGQVKIDKRYALIKGRFFLPMNLTDLSQFNWPDWLSPSFPMHKWCDRRDKANLTRLESSQLRLAHYIEWFTKRSFYDGPQTKAVELNQREDDWLPRTGLYFEGDKPVVIYPQHQNAADN
ncbi:DUF1853 family protein [Psychrobacter jeotgali]|uniref:DUF1853 family protein n=1 Tax=Psychrobacter jeotgali TaxID=179010 RepID=UPI0019195FE5|nr:DUF1853 family protein [Psychrobacter jeotgali]